MIRPPAGIVVHHSLTEDSDTLSWGAIREYHKAKSYLDIGYHAGCELVRGHYEVLIGRPETIDGAHTLGKNDTHLGFCFVGNYDNEEPDIEMLATAARLWLGPVCVRYGLTEQDITPHSDYSPKTCPGKFFDLNTLRMLTRTAIISQGGHT